MRSCILSSRRHGDDPLPMGRIRAQDCGCHREGPGSIRVRPGSSSSRTTTGLEGGEDEKNLQPSQRERHPASALAVLACALLAGTSAARAADVTYERLLNPEPQNWLMNHRDLQRAALFAARRDQQVERQEPEARCSRCALGGSAGNESLEATPLVDDGFMYIADRWGVVYKIDVRSGTAGRIVWKMDPGRRSSTATAASRCGATW